METIRAKAGEIAVTIEGNFLNNLERAVENIEELYYDNRVNLYYEDYTLESIRFTKKGIRVKYRTPENKILIQTVKFEEYVETIKKII